MDTSAATTRYLIGLGSNRYRGGPPRRTIDRAIDALAARGLEIVRRSSVVTTPPLGPGTRHYANAAILAQTDLSPPDLLALCQAIEAAFGRRSGRRWGDRILDLDLLLWSGGCWADHTLTLPHPALAMRDFVLGPLGEIAPGWRHPVSGRTIRQLDYHVRRNMPVDRGPNRP
ncbi:2-amino-4-hydroxy-6-hydroxymethyldihydropteridine diphosphokinase [Parasphingopyxis algicola]|uniref:2-amino-4-hydroxy-6- hydroxymethyldihydropteridine diphosphokinase n=1 Tax=Parasphingopyxis algicola TaxID=2026624 RepID=UPI0015A46766|nr:2-amino-4-hydroxy-6-hydroxymethyldihydropteridine diphosphokinase [Parasphingopyxis algicola]QLC26819.1 2-amino-4-hydroxy-6-hydroxymethyldihydropteridine diphosphokinase [Parasphingopyxis algicola]